MATEDPNRSLAEELVALLRSRHPAETAVDFWQRQFAALRDAWDAIGDGLDRLGVEAFNRGDLEAAKEAFFGLFLLRLAIVQEERDSRAAIRDFASAEDLLGQTLIETGQLVPAERMLAEALAYREGLAHDEPDDVHAAYLLGVSLTHMGRLAAAKGDRATARNWFLRAQAQLKVIDASYPNVSFVVAALEDVQANLDLLTRQR